MTLPQGQIIEFIKSFEELDEAMFNRFDGFTIDGNPVELTYYTPDVDLAELSPPSIVLYRTTPYLDKSRWKKDTIRDNYIYNDEGKPIQFDVRNYPESWSILYTVKTIYDYQMDGVLLNNFIIQQFLRGESDFITVKGVNYDVEMTSAGLWGSQYKDFGRIEDGKRRFQETYSFRVDFLYDVFPRKTIKAVQEVVPHITIKK